MGIGGEPTGRASCPANVSVSTTTSPYSVTSRIR